MSFKETLSAKMAHAHTADPDAHDNYFGRAESSHSDMEAQSADEIDEFGVPAIVKAAADGNVQELRRLLATLPRGPSESPSSLAGPESLGAALDGIRIVEKGGHNILSPSVWNDHGQNALIKATRNNHAKCVEILLEEVPPTRDSG